jgi:4-hydroxy-4-methyl-2-oxoglutarate aldolase
MKFAPLNLSPEEIIEYTPDWQGERTADGRPRVADDILTRMRRVSVTQAWGLLRNEGYNWQYEGDWQCTHPGGTLVGRAVTAVYMPRRPVIRQIMEAKGAECGCIGDQISWPIDALVPGDVYVADCFGLVENGPIIGDNLATSIYAHSGNGVVFDGSVRDLEGIEEIAGFCSYVRGWHPAYSSPTIMLMGLNAPVRIGHATVMPGDVVLGKREGVIFVPPHLAQKVVEGAEIIRLRDDFGKLRLSEGRYTPGQIDTRWSDEIERDFSGWLEAHLDELPVPRETVQDYLRERTW